jgi:hypothetical protein
MLTHEWRELEVLCQRISDLRHRYVAAQRTKNVGLIEGLKDDIAKARRQREFLVQYISARLGSAAADHDLALAVRENVDEDAASDIHGFRAG